MQDQYVIMGRGFKNLVENGEVKGYQINVRMPYYRGTFLSLVDYLDLVVDGKQIPVEQLRIVVAGKSHTVAEMMEQDELRWDFGDAATLQVLQAGGLQPGQHTIQVGMVIRKSYLPPTDPDRLYADFADLYKGGVYRTYIEGPTVVTRKMTLVQ